jgi:tetratricopeptide (TPR) repeat protein
MNSATRSDSNPYASFWLDRLFVGAGMVILLAGTILALWPSLCPSRYDAAQRACLEGFTERSPAIRGRAEAALKAFPDDPFFLAIAAATAEWDSDDEAALAYYERMPRDGGMWEFQRDAGIGRRLDIQGRFEESLGAVASAWRLNPANTANAQRYGHLLQVGGMVWESRPIYFGLLLRGVCRGDELLAAATVERFYRRDERMEQQGLSGARPDPLMLLGEARRLTFAGEKAEAEQLLRQVIAVHPEWGEAQGRLGRIIHDRGDSEEFLRWRGGLVTASATHPEVLFVEGLELRRRGRIPAAVHCLLAALERSPYHLAANLQVAGALSQMGRAADGEQFAVRAAAVSDLEGALNSAREDTDPAKVRDVIAALRRLGRGLEAAGWATLLPEIHRPQEDPWPLVKLLARQVRYQPADEQLSPGLLIEPGPRPHLASRDFPPPQWSLDTPRVVVSRDAGRERTAESTFSVRLPDRAKELGMSHRYFEGTNEDRRLEHIFSTMGGGLAAYDYDGDGWCDLYLAQGCDWRKPERDPEHTDRLFRNVGGSRSEGGLGAVDVSAAAGLGDLELTHGAAAADYDQDGFLDLALGNLGPNRLYRNLGDGTYLDVTDAAGVAGNDWSTSLVFADFNGDAAPDLFVANYSLAETTRTQICRDVEGREIACTPGTLPAADDRLYLSEGDGRFRDVTSAAGVSGENGRGLGLIAWDFEGTGRLGLFVANDTTANFLYVQQGAAEEGVPKFVEQAVVRGLAFDQDGKAQASMGVAAGDANGDGLLDLFVTNFFGESNTLYVQRPDRTFADLTRPAGLAEPSYWMLGFGTQMADVDEDGWEDLLVTNGHVDQRSSRGDPDRMPPQLYRNRGGAGFSLVDSPQLGPYFDKRTLGRGLARLDWNRDGRWDFGISPLHDDFALLVAQPSAGEALNRSGSVVNMRLIGTSGCRDPVGAALRIVTKTEELVRLRTAGDGFLVTNEPRMMVHLAQGEEVVRIEVAWPGKGWEAVGIPPGGVPVSEWVIVEGR